MNTQAYGHTRLLMDGKRLSEEMDGAKADGTPEAAVWALTREAARTWRSIPGLPRLGYPGKSAWPEVLIPAAERFGVAREQATDHVEAAVERPRLMPTAAQVTRSEILADAWQRHAFRHLGDRRRILLAVWCFASGIRPAKIREQTGFHRNRLYRARDMGCEDVATALFRVNA